MESTHFSSTVRKGRFLWMDDKAKDRFLRDLHRKITEGFYTSDRILARVADELAPTFSETLENSAV